MAETASSDSIVLNARCHCKSNDFNITVPKSALPLRSAICQCWSCRHSTGTLAPSTIAFPEELGIKPPDLSKLTEYKISERLSTYFCGTCGAQICTIEPDGWDISNGILDKTGDLLERLIIWTEDTIDGGFSVFLHENNGEPVKSYWTSSVPSKGKGEVTDEQKREFTEKAKAVVAATKENEWPSKDEKLRCRCHCGGVDFFVTRPTLDFPPPDVKTSMNGGRWWLDGGYKYTSMPCPCESCRRCSGHELSSLAYVPKTNCIWNDGKLMEFNEGTLKTYHSTPGVVEREFCKVCGAKVFYRSPERRALTGVLDIYMGLVDDPSGSRAQDWFSFGPDKWFETDSLDIEFNRSLTKGIRSWNKEVFGTSDDA